jgi:hypothetical protein
VSSSIGRTLRPAPRPARELTSWRAHVRERDGRISRDPIRHTGDRTRRRQGGTRPRDFSSPEFRRRVKVEEHAEELVILLNAARRGEWRVVGLMLDRVFGRPTETIALKQEEPEFVQELRALTVEQRRQVPRAWTTEAAPMRR